MVQNWTNLPTSLGRGRSTRILSYGSGVIFFSTFSPEAFTLISGTWTKLSLPLPNTIYGNNQGYAFAAPGALGSVWACGYLGPLISVDSSGIVNTYSWPSGIDFVGGMTSDPSGNPWIVAANGSVWKWNGTALVQVASNPGGSAVGPAQGAAWQNNKFYTLFAGSNQVYELTTGSTPTWSADSIAGISDGPYALGTTTSDVALSYMGDITLPFPANQIKGAGVVSQFLISDTTNNLVRVVGLAAGRWASLQTLSVANASYIDVLPSNTYALVSNTAGNAVAVLQNLSGVWSLNTTLSVTNPNGIAISPDGTYGVICQKSLNQVIPFTYSGGIFTLGSPFGVLTPTVAAFNADGSWLYVGNNGAITAVQYNAGNWIVGSTVPITGASIVDIACIAVQKNIVAAGYAGGVVVVNGTVLQGSGVYNPSSPPPASLGFFSAVAPNQIVPFEDGFLIADSGTGGYLNKLEPTANGYTYSPTYTGPYSAVGSTLANGRLYVMAASGSTLKFYNPNYASILTPSRYTFVSILSSTTGAITITLNLGEGLKIAGLGYDGTFLWASDCLQNEVFKLSFGATPGIVDSAIIQPPSPQLSNSLSGLSGVSFIGSSIYIASVFQGGLLVVS